GAGLRRALAQRGAPADLAPARALALLRREHAVRAVLGGRVARALHAGVAAAHDVLGVGGDVDDAVVVHADAQAAGGLAQAAEGDVLRRGHARAPSAPR